ncbi:hypothetical protein [Paenibacillus sp.]|uniref:hypothetical protein n=1 Tax=Paenibacillus sp. TaxID=58172 RepID=UPI002D398FCE|nr:hypothetical protein [Paenibacillus sp.]HZG84717.1 hypothetical protein [Paenibacillus sp.]
MSMQARTGQGNDAAALFRGEGALTLAGLLGFLLAGVCGAWALAFGGGVAPDGDVWKAFSFNAALGVFLLSTAAILPLSGLSDRGKRLFRRSYLILAMYSYFAETAQHFRGVNPRFPEGGAAFDTFLGIGFGIVALLLVLAYAALAAQYFRKRAAAIRPDMVLAIRYAMAAVMLSFAAGIGIALNGGSAVGESGSLLWLHGLGFHALQALPFAAWLAERKARARERRGLIHFAGASYAAGLAAVGWQTALGEPVLSWSLPSLLAFACFAASLAPAARLLWNDARKRSAVRRRRAA